jgi:hypothetical protein
VKVDEERLDVRALRLQRRRAAVLLLEEGAEELHGLHVGLDRAGRLPSGV